MDDESQFKHMGCMWAFRKMIHFRRPHHSFKLNWSPLHDDDGDGGGGYEELLDEQESPLHHHGAKKRSRSRSRIKALNSKETSKEDGASLQKTFSIHHLESLDDLFGKIRNDWNNPIFFLPRNSDDHAVATGEDSCDLPSPKDKPDVFEIFKVDKELLQKHLHESDEGTATSSQRKFSKSRSFPVADSAQRRKLKPLKIETKHNEVWSFPRDDKVQGLLWDGDVSNGLLGQGVVNKYLRQKQRNGDAEISQSLDYMEENNAVDMVGIRKHTHNRSSSLNESLDKYARLFETSFRKEDKLSSSQSLRLTSDYGYAPLFFERRRSISSADSYYSEVLGEIPFGANLDVIAEDSSSGLQYSDESDIETTLMKENYASLRFHTGNETCKNDESYEDEGHQLKGSDSNCSDINFEEVQNQEFISDSEIFLNEIDYTVVELHVIEGEEEYESRIDNLDDQRGKPLSSSQNLEKYETKEKTKYHDKKTPEMDYVRQLLDKSGIAIDASEMPWHASDQLISPQLFEEVEACWPYEEDQLDGLSDFQGYWHHKMIFDLVNELLLDVYDVSLPYYPKALSSSCHVRPFPMGDHIVDEVCTSIGTLMSVKLEEKQSVDFIVDRDLLHDRKWMNLQLESESVAVYIEDMIFDELLQEVIFS